MSAGHGWPVVVGVDGSMRSSEAVRRAGRQLDEEDGPPTAAPPRHGSVEEHEETVLHDALASWRSRYPDVPVRARLGPDGAAPPLAGEYCPVSDVRPTGRPAVEP